MLAILVTGAALLSDRAEVRLEQEIDDNWRGAYDLLVLSGDQNLRVGETDGLVEPNFLGFVGDGGISMQQLDAIQDMPGVDVAAPIMTVGLLRHVDPVPSLFTSALPDDPTLYRLTLTVTTDDGISERLIQSETGMVVLGPADLESGAQPPFLSEFDFSWASDGVEIGFTPLPSIAGLAIAVDPVAEKELLGSSAQFLDPLIAAASVERQAGTFSVGIPADQFPLEALELDFAAGDPSTASRPVVPLVASQTLYSDISVSVAIDELATLEEFPDSLADVADEADGVGPRLEADLQGSGILRPFSTPSLGVLWPGSQPPDGETYISATTSALEPTLVERPEYAERASRDEGRPSFTIKPVGPVSADGGPPGSVSLEEAPRMERVTVGLEAAYREIGRTEVPWTEPPLLAPIGTYDLASLELPDNPLNYVPFGAYDPPATMLVAGPDGRSVEPKGVTGTLNPAGLIQAPPLAVTDLAGAEALRGDVSIGAIRVRVSRLGSFDLAQPRLEELAGRIRGMGLDVRIVAGASPQPVEIYVPGYYPEATETQDLGWVQQRWTTLGAAQRVTASLSATSFSLFALSIATAISFAIGINMSRHSARIQEIGTLRLLGWPERRIRRWYLGEAAAGSVWLLAASLGVWLTVRGAPEGLVAALLIAAVYPLGGIVADLVTTLFGNQRSILGPPWATSKQIPRNITTAARYGVRAAVAAPMRSLALLVPLVTLSLALAHAANVIVVSRADAGPTLLAGHAAGVLQGPHLTMLAGILLGSAGLVAFLLRLDAQARVAEWRILTVTGWRRRDVMEARLAEVGSVAIAALSISIVAMIAIGILSRGEAPPLVLGLLSGAMSVVLACVAGLVSVRRVWGSSFGA